MLSLTVGNGADVIADLSGYHGKITRGAVRALNRAIASGRAAMVKEIAADTGLKAGDVRDAIPLRNATAARLEAAFGAKLKRIPLFSFKAKRINPSRPGGRGRGVSYVLGRGRSKIPNAFLATMKSGHTGVFVRKGRAHLPVAELYGPSLGHVFAKLRPLGLARTKEAFDTAFAHELSRLRDKQAGA